MFDNLQVQINPRPSENSFNIGHTDVLITWLHYDRKSFDQPIIKRSYTRYRYLIPNNQFERAKQISAFELRQRDGFYR